MAGGAPPTVISDRTPLQGPVVDVAARIGWVLRTARLTAAGGPPSLHAMAARLGTSVARLHRLETGQVRNGSLVDGYERVLGRPEGSLRAPIDVLCRTFPQQSPGDQDPGGVVSTVRELSDLTARVAPTVRRPGDAAEAPYDAAVPGGHWLAWARALSHPGAIGMPEWTAHELVTRLLGELNRSVGIAYPMRYEALALLRNGPYGEVVLDVAREALLDPHVQVLNDMMSAVGERVTPDAVAWCLGLLTDDRDRVVVGAVLALENMGTIGGTDDFWAGIVGEVVDRFDETEPGTERWRWLSHLVRLVPPTVATSRVRRLGQRLAPPARVETWSQTRRNQHWTDCEARARAVTDTLGLPEQPMLARLVFDIVVSPYESHAVTSYMLLSGLPLLADPVSEQLVAVAETHPDAVIRERAGRRLAGMLHHAMPRAAHSWLGGSDPDLRDRALLMAGCAGAAVPDEVLRRAVEDGPRSQRAALYAAGMTRHPLLDELRSHADEDVAGAAAWWTRQGPRLVEPGEDV